MPVNFPRIAFIFRRRLDLALSFMSLISWRILSLRCCIFVSFRDSNESSTTLGGPRFVNMTSISGAKSAKSPSPGMIPTTKSISRKITILTNPMMSNMSKQGTAQSVRKMKKEVMSPTKGASPRKKSIPACTSIIHCMLNIAIMPCGPVSTRLIFFS